MAKIEEEAKKTFVIVLLFLMIPVSLRWFEMIKDFFSDSNDNNAEVALKFSTSFLPDNSVEIINDTSYYNFNSIRIPSKIEIDGKEYTVKAIGEKAFANCENLKNIEIPNTIHMIRASAFSQCYNLRTIEIPSSVFFIDYSAFKHDTQLHVLIHDASSSVDYSAFNYCKTVTYILKTPNNREPIWFNDLGRLNLEVTTNKAGYQLDSVFIPENVKISDLSYKVTKIGFCAFKNSNQLKYVDIPETVNSIEGYAFSGCTNLTSIKIPLNVQSVGNYMFDGCSSLEKIVMPSNIQYGLKNSFSGCYKYDVTIIENGGNKLTKEDFPNCKSITYVK